MLPVIAPDRAWTLAVLTHTAALLLVSSLWFGAGLPYALGAGTGGLIFLWKSITLYRSPTTRAALGNFLASLVQLSLLLTGVILDAVTRHWW